MSNKLAYIYACDVFIKIGFSIKKKKNLVIGPRCFPRLWKSVQVTEPLDQHQKIRHLAQKSSRHNTFKSDDKYSSP